MKIAIAPKYLYLVGISRWESLYTRIVIWINTILLIPGRLLTRYKGSHMVYRPEWYSKQQHCQIPITLQASKNSEILLIDIQMVWQKDDTRPTLVSRMSGLFTEYKFFSRGKLQAYEQLDLLISHILEIMIRFILRFKLLNKISTQNLWNIVENSNSSAVIWKVDQISTEKQKYDKET